MKRDLVLEIVGITKHQYYYQRKGGKQGRRPSTTTKMYMEEDLLVAIPNENVVDDIKDIAKDPDLDYGYHKMTFALMQLGYLINHKKVYRLMEEYHLLKEMHKKPKRSIVKYRKVLPTEPLQVLEMDIKFVWVEEHRRHAYILTVIDTFSRVLLGRKTAYAIKQSLVQELWMEVIENHLQPYDCLNRKIDIEIRNDNDSRFAAKQVQEFFKENKLNQVFTHPYTPQENAHIESFHSILSRKLDRYDFWSLQELEDCLTLFYEKYNNQRIHSSTANLSPMHFWSQWRMGNVRVTVNEKQRTTKFKLLVPYQQLSGNWSQKGVPCPHRKPLDGVGDEKIYEMSGAATFQQPSV